MRDRIIRIDGTDGKAWNEEGGMGSGDGIFLHLAFL